LSRPQKPWPRALVTAWVAQNILLVASTALRTLRYVEVYSLTRLRIAALVWMALVGLGLALICWRMLRGKSGAWLINANAAAALLVLAASCVVDLGAVAAAWNVRHAREVGGRGAALDLCYLDRLGGSAAVSLVRLERISAPGLPSEQIAALREGVVEDLRAEQSDWRSWSLRGALRLARIEALQAGRPVASSAWAPDDRGCGGRPLHVADGGSEGGSVQAPPPPAPEPAASPTAPVLDGTPATQPLTQTPEH